MFRGSDLKLAKLLVAFALVQRFFVSAELLAAEAPAPMPYSGDIWRRSTLTGDWGGLRNELAVKASLSTWILPRLGKVWSVPARVAHGNTAGVATSSSI